MWGGDVYGSATTCLFPDVDHRHPPRQTSELIPPRRLHVKCGEQRQTQSQIYQFKSCLPHRLWMPFSIIDQSCRQISIFINPDWPRHSAGDRTSTRWNRWNLCRSRPTDGRGASCRLLQPSIMAVAWLGQHEEKEPNPCICHRHEKGLGWSLGSEPFIITYGKAKAGKFVLELKVKKRKKTQPMWGGK